MMVNASVSALLVTIIDYGMGNLFSIKHACDQVGMKTQVTSEKQGLSGAEVVILPGVGAFGDAMRILHSLDLVAPLREHVNQGKVLMGVCLGMQLLMEEGEEFGTHRGLGFLPGTVERFETPREGVKTLKIPHVGWNGIFPDAESALNQGKTQECPPAWRGTPLQETPAGAYMYFVHSYCVKPVNPADTLAFTRYGDQVFCSGVRRDNIIAFQFHPERSGTDGLAIYRNLTALVRRESN